MLHPLLSERNVLVPMRDGVELAVDVLRPDQPGQRFPALLNFGPYHKDGRGGRLSVDSVHRHFVAMGYAGVSADLRGLGNSAGNSPGAFAPGEALDGHDLVEWIARQPWCDGNVGMWGVSYPGVTALATAATRPPHLKAIVPIHASADLHRGVVSLGGTGSGFWMRADWGPRMAAYNLMPPLLQDTVGRWASVWAEHLAGNTPWLEAFSAHPAFDAFWQARVVDLAHITCPTFSICGWRDLYADCTPRDYAAITATRKLMMGAWKHEFPDVGKEAPAAGLWDMQRWFDRWLKDVRNGIDTEPPVSLYVQGRAGAWRAGHAWPPENSRSCELFLHADGVLAAPVPDVSDTTSSHTYDPTVGMHSLAWDPWTTSLDPSVLWDHAADDARSLCFTGAALGEPLEVVGIVHAVIELQASALPLNLVVKLSAVASNGRSTLITSGWADLTAHTAGAGERTLVSLALRATAFRLAAGERLRVAIACADFPRVWPTPVPAVLRVFHGRTCIRLPISAPNGAETQGPKWGPLQPEVLAATADLGGSQTWGLTRDLTSDTVTLNATKTEGVRIGEETEVSMEHSYKAAVSASRPDLAHMSSTTRVTIARPVGRTELLARTVTTAHQTSVDVDIRVDGQPFWHRQWLYQQGVDSSSAWVRT